MLVRAPVFGVADLEKYLAFTIIDDDPMLADVVSRSRFSERIEQVLQPVDFDFVHDTQHVAQFSLWKTFVGKPDDVGFRQIDQQPLGVSAEWHAIGCQFE